MSELRAKLVEYAGVVKIEVADQDDATLQSQIVDAVDKLDDAQFQVLPEELAVWVSEIIKAENAATEPAKEGKAAGEKLATAKKTAKASAAAVKHTSGGRVFNQGSSSYQIYDLVVKKPGMTADEVVAAAQKAGIKSSNLDGRVKDVLKMCSKVKGLSCSGILRCDGDKYFPVPEEELKALRGPEKAEKPAAKPKKAAKKAAEPEAPAETPETQTAEVLDKQPAAADPPLPEGGYPQPPPSPPAPPKPPKPPKPEKGKGKGKKK